MIERPILFSGPMVRALLDGQKTQTRRIVKLDVPADADEVFFWSAEGLRASCANVAEPGLWARKHGRDGYLRYIGKCPYGVPGDTLWVRETWRKSDTPSGFTYADDTPLRVDRRGRVWKPSIHMPRAACRIRLGITEVRVERLQDITEADAEAEGVEHPGVKDVVPPGAWWSPRDGYARLWEHINGKGRWAANPWVWAVTFEVRR